MQYPAELVLEWVDLRKPVGVNEPLVHSLFPIGDHGGPQRLLEKPQARPNSG